MTTVIFDFDGTIANSFPVIMDIFHKLTNLPAPDKKEVERLRQLPIHDLAKELHIPRWRVPFLLWRGRRQMKNRVGEVKLFPDVADVIKRFHANGYQLFVMSSNDTTAIEAFLKQYKLDKYFTRVYGNIGLFAKGRALEKILRENAISRDNCYYLGDEVRDIEAALSAHVKQIAVTWGYNAEVVLKAYYPTALVREPKQLLKAVK